MTTPPCTAITKAGRPCGKMTGTTPTAEGPRCYSHLAREKRLADPGSRPPIRRLRTVEDARTLASWAAIRAACGKLSAPSANATSAMVRTFLRVNQDRTRAQLRAQQDVISAAFRLLQALGKGDVAAQAKAQALLNAAWDRMHEVFKLKSAPEDQEARERREHERAIAALDPDDAPLDDEEDEPDGGDGAAL